MLDNVLRFILLDRALYCALFQNFPSGNCKRKTSGWCFWNIATFSSFSIKDMLTLSITKFIKPSRDSLVVCCICSLYSSKEIWWQAEEMTGGWPCSVCRYFICLVTSDFMSGGIVKMCFRCLIMKEMRSCAVFLKQKRNKFNSTFYTHDRKLNCLDKVCIHILKLHLHVYSKNSSLEKIRNYMSHTFITRYLHNFHLLKQFFKVFIRIVFYIHYFILQWNNIFKCFIFV